MRSRKRRATDWLVARQAGDRMAGAHQRLEHRTADIAGGAREKDPQSLSNPSEGIAIVAL